MMNNNIDTNNTIDNNEANTIDTNNDTLYYVQQFKRKIFKHIPMKNGRIYSILIYLLITLNPIKYLLELILIS
jgi:hypothetical protein